MAGQLIADPQNPPAPDDVVVYVHGTFAPDAPWTLPESELTRALKEELPDAGFYRFRWSGANSHQARLEAGRALREAFCELHLLAARARLHVVTHSHGGNVLVYALAHQPVSVASVICLATPFLYIRDSGVRISRWSGYFIAVLSLMGYLAVATAALSAWRAGLFIGVTALVLFGLGTAVILIAYLVELVRKRAVVNGWDFSLPVLEQQSVLILRPVGDEAAGVLGAAHLASWVLKAVWSHARRLLQMTTWIALGVMVAIAAGMSQAERLGFTGSGSSAAVEEGLIAGFVAATLVIGAVVVGLLATMVLCQLPFGRDALVLTLRAITTVEDSPPGNQTVQQVSLPSGDRGLAHSRLYEHPSVIQGVVAFVASRSTARSLKA